MIWKKNSLIDKVSSYIFAEILIFENFNEHENPIIHFIQL